MSVAQGVSKAFGVPAYLALLGSLNGIVAINERMHEHMDAVREAMATEEASRILTNFFTSVLSSYEQGLPVNEGSYFMRLARATAVNAVARICEEQGTTPPTQASLSESDVTSGALKMLSSGQSVYSLLEAAYARLGLRAGVQSAIRHGLLTSDARARDTFSLTQAGIDYVLLQRVSGIECVLQ